MRDIGASSFSPYPRSKKDIKDNMKSSSGGDTYRAWGYHAFNLLARPSDGLSSDRPRFVEIQVTSPLIVK